MTQIAWRDAVVATAAALLLAGCGPAAPDKAGTTSSAPAGAHRKCAAGEDLDQCPTVTDSPTTSSTPPAPAPKAPAPKSPTVAQQQALEAARSYLDTGSFSQKGLLRQLTSKAGDGFSKADATWAVNHVNADWNAEAVEAARSYLEMGGFSHASLLQQLTSSAGDEFTKAQAQYAVKKVGL